MAKDVCSKPASNSNSENSSSPTSDQQKVPPLRIVLNTSGNQKSSISTITSSATATTSNLNNSSTNSNNFDNKREKGQSNKAENVAKTSGRVRIKLGTSKQASKTNTQPNDSISNNKSEDTNKPRITNGDKQTQSIDQKEDSNISYSHLRRITRRSQRSVQTINNEDEESVSSMTSVDENQNSSSNNCNNSDNNNGRQEAASAASNQNVPSSGTSLNNQTSNGSNNSTTSGGVDSSRRYKRRRGEPSESQLSSELDIFGWQNYKLPVQNSFELFRSIRLQVDKKLGSLNVAHPRFPYGFKDYMITRGAYLLDGNKLGNGTNLFMNEDGGLNTMPISKIHALRFKTNYSVPDRAKAPLGLPKNSPLYNMFIEQEKDRHKMRMQHLKEREKLTLAAEQEIVRVYNQAAMAAANQIEPFSACTMLKHQEIYNYIDADGFTLQAAEDETVDQTKQDGVRTRRRQHEHVSSSPAQTRKQPSSDDQTQEADSTSRKDKSKCPKKDQNDEESTQRKSPPNIESVTPNKSEDQNTSDSTNKPVTDHKMEIAEETIDTDKGASGKESGDGSLKEEKQPEVCESKIKVKSTSDPSETKENAEKCESNEEESQVNSKAESKESSKPVEADSLPKDDEASQIDDANPKKKQKVEEANAGAKKTDEECKETQQNSEVPGTKQEEQVNQDSKQAENRESDSSEPILSDDDRRAYNKEVFLSQLREIDDKWDRIRGEMLIRHRNEAESLHAVQKLEWEWKIKEIGACDVRTTPVIDETLVPKLVIYSQDY